MLLEADRYRPSILNASEQMLTHLRWSRVTLVLYKNTALLSNKKIKSSNHQILYLLTPLRNSKSFCPSGIEKTRMTVPWEEVKGAWWMMKHDEGKQQQHSCLAGYSHAQQLFTFSEAVASLVPLASKARAANGLSWAGIMFAARWVTNEKQQLDTC